MIEESELLTPCFLTTWISKIKLPCDWGCQVRVAPSLEPSHSLRESIPPIPTPNQERVYPPDNPGVSIRFQNLGWRHKPALIKRKKWLFSQVRVLRTKTEPSVLYSLNIVRHQIRESITQWIFTPSGLVPLWPQGWTAVLLCPVCFLSPEFPKLKPVLWSHEKPRIFFLLFLLTPSFQQSPFSKCNSRLPWK